jgi:hypothetical protein
MTMTAPDQVIPPAIEPPVCPHCNEQCVGIALFFWQVSGWLVVASNCPSCRTILSTQMMPMGEPPQAESRIQRPS